MIKLSTISLVLLSLLILAIGAAIGYYYRKRTDKAKKVIAKATNKENDALQKQVKKAEKDLNKWKKKNEDLKNKVANQEADAATKLETVQAKLTAALADNTALKEDERAKKLTSQQLKTDLDRLEKAHKKLTEKYKQDTTNLKEWTRDRTIFNRQFKEVKAKLKTSEEQVAKLQTKNAELAKEIADNSAFVARLRSLRAQNKKFKEDLAYWEKKHYDVHHDYSALKTKIDGIVERNEQLELINQTATQNNQQMLKKVQEFKTRFVDMNNKYHKLREATQN